MVVSRWLRRSKKKETDTKRCGLFADCVRTLAQVTRRLIRHSEFFEKKKETSKREDPPDRGTRGMR